MTTAFRERYPGPWEIEASGECVRVVARDGTVLACIYYEEQPTRRALTHRVTLPEARALAKAIGNLAG
jgi:hypothetical protein